MKIRERELVVAPHSTPSRLLSAPLPWVTRSLASGLRFMWPRAGLCFRRPCGTSLPPPPLPWLGLPQTRPPPAPLVSASGIFHSGALRGASRWSASEGSYVGFLFTYAPNHVVFGPLSCLSSWTILLAYSGFRGCSTFLGRFLCTTQRPATGSSRTRSPPVHRRSPGLTPPCPLRLPFNSLGCLPPPPALHSPELVGHPSALSHFFISPSSHRVLPTPDTTYPTSLRLAPAVPLGLSLPSFLSVLSGFGTAGGPGSPPFIFALRPTPPVRQLFFSTHLVCLSVPVQVRSCTDLCTHWLSATLGPPSLSSDPKWRSATLAHEIARARLCVAAS